MDDILTKVVQRLRGFGYNADLSDTSEKFMLDFSIDKNKHYILNQTNRETVPKELVEIWVDRTVADFLEVKYATNTLNIDTINIQPVISRIQEGDTTVDIATAKDGGLTDEDRFRYILDGLRQPDFSYARFRRFTW